MKPYIFTTGDITKKDLNQDILKDPQKWIKEKMTGSKFGFGIDNLTRTSTFKLMGWAYPFREYLKKYVYKQYGSWHEIWALNKTNVRHLVSGRIERILEVE